MSVGYLEDAALALDLVYLEDSKAHVDLNCVATKSGKIVEVQGTAEGAPVERTVIDRMIDMAVIGIQDLTIIQAAVLSAAGVDLRSLTIGS